MSPKRPWLEHYGIDNWGAGYFEVNSQGNVIVYAGKNSEKSVELIQVVKAATEKGCRPPLVIRFPQILTSRLSELAQAFRRAINEFEYKNQYQGVFPLKVNPRAEVVEEIVTAGSGYKFGLEVGSKAELCIAVAQNLPSGALLVCNGHKDEAFLKLALLASRVGKRTIIVIENPEEANLIAELAGKYGIAPELGIRVKLYSRGSGRWEKSGGEDSKFGMTTAQLLWTIKFLRSKRLLKNLKMLHFHIGSQITQIKRIKTAMREAARVYTKAKKLAPSLSILNVGGGLGVDYDGSQSASTSSANYSIQEYANDVVYTVKEVCDSENVKHPLLITESGRVIAAYHSILVMPLLTQIDANNIPKDIIKLKPKKADPDTLRELFDISKAISVKNYREYLRDAIERREDLFNLFDLGFLTLEERAKGEMLFGKICEKTKSFITTLKDLPDEYNLLMKRLASRYIFNFSVFQSLPDIWALEQLFPIMPIHRLNEPPTHHGTIADITCDSDGVIEQFVHPQTRKDFLDLHETNDEPYLLGVFLVGAYQDVIGDYHNLFGTVDEVVVEIAQEQDFEIRQPVLGDKVKRAIETVRYDVNKLKEQFLQSIPPELDAKLANAIKEAWKSGLEGYTYLVTKKTTSTDSKSLQKDEKKRQK